MIMPVKNFRKPTLHGLNIKSHSAYSRLFLLGGAVTGKVGHFFDTSVFILKAIQNVLLLLYQMYRFMCVPHRLCSEKVSLDSDCYVTSLDLCFVLQFLFLQLLYSINKICLLLNSILSDREIFCQPPRSYFFFSLIDYDRRMKEILRIYQLFVFPCNITGIQQRRKTHLCDI